MKVNISLSPFAPENLASIDGFGSPVPRQPAHLNSQAEFGTYLRDSSRVPRRRPFICVNRHTPSRQSRVYRVKQLRTDGISMKAKKDENETNQKYKKKRNARERQYGIGNKKNAGRVQVRATCAYQLWRANQHDEHASSELSFP